MTGILDQQTHPELATWRSLLEKAIRAVAVVERSTGLPQQIRIGGGTVLSALWGHRYSRDLDLFTRDPQVLSYLRPWLDDEVAAILGTDYTEATNAIKFRLGRASIDIVAAADILPDSRPTIETFRGRQVEIDDPAEIIAKKLFHRGDRGTVRDHVDLVRGMQEIPDLARRLAIPLGHKTARAAEVLRQMSADRFSAQLDAIRFIGSPPDPDVLRDQALAALGTIAAAAAADDHTLPSAWLEHQRNRDDRTQ